ncbi:MAG: sulfotransferase [Proteobacteria bacterium]|nr:sulfotransferase [Pseudomonadota bacterium]
MAHKHLFIVGAQRTGTTYLYKVLDAHPVVYMAKPIKPEPKYFLDSDNVVEGYATYFSTYFSDAGDVSWFGEKSTSYIENEEAALAIKRIMPDALILVMLRDPVERAISHYSFTRDHDLEPYDIERAIQEETARKDNWHAAGTSVTPYAYTERGKYAQYLEYWERLFGKDNLILLVAEQFIGNLSAVSMLYQRLGICPDFIPPSLTERVNAGSPGRAKCKMTVDFRASLQEMFRPWNRKLEEGYGLDLSCWEKKA